MSWSGLTDKSVVTILQTCKSKKANINGALSLIVNADTTPPS